MDLKISRYRNYLYQFSNIVLGSSIIILLLSLKAAPTGWGEWAEQVFIFLVAFGAIFHGWWRNSELFTTSKAKTAGVYSVGVLRIVLLMLSLLWLRSISAIQNPPVFHYQILFGILAATLWVGLLQQIVFLGPLYGKTRVMQKREYLTDLFYALSMTVYLVGLFFLPEAMWGLIGYGVIAICIVISRPIAKASTPWAELAPPHRGGRNRRERTQRSGSRSTGGHSRSRGPERDPRERGPRRPVQDRDRSMARNERPMAKSSRTRPENRRRTAVPNRANSNREAMPDSRRVVREPKTRRDESVERQKRVNEPAENDGQKYGRRRRGRKPITEQQEKRVEQKDASKAIDKTLDNGSSKESPERALLEKTESKDTPKIKYGRKKVKARSEAGQAKENENSVSES